MPSKRSRGAGHILSLRVVSSTMCFITFGRSTARQKRSSATAKGEVQPFSPLRAAVAKPGNARDCC